MRLPGWRVRLFWKESAAEGLWVSRALLEKALYSDTSQNSPTPWLDLGPLAPPVLRPQDRLARQATLVVNTTAQLARPEVGGCSPKNGGGSVSLPGKEAAPGLDCHSHESRWRRHKAHTTQSMERARTFTNIRERKRAQGGSYIRQGPGAAHGRGHAKTHTWSHRCPRMESRLQNARPRERGTRTPTPERDGDTMGGHPHAPEAPTPRTSATQRSREWTHRRVAEGPLAYRGCHPPDGNARAAGGCAHKGATPTLAQTPRRDPSSQKGNIRQRGHTHWGRQRRSHPQRTGTPTHADTPRAPQTTTRGDAHTPTLTTHPRRGCGGPLSPGISAAARQGDTSGSPAARQMCTHRGPQPASLGRGPPPPPRALHVSLRAGRSGRQRRRQARHVGSSAHA